MRHDYKVFLFSIYKENRKNPFWNDLASLHDEEDNACFKEWDEIGGLNAKDKRANEREGANGMASKRTREKP